MRHFLEAVHEQRASEQFALRLAEMEGLGAHAHAIEVRLE